MRRASNLASSALSRTLHHHRFLQAALYASSRKRWFSTTLDSISALGIAGALVSVAGASLLFQEEAYAKEPPRPEFVPKDVVLYQYDACPFCNKVKGITFSFSIFSFIIWKMLEIWYDSWRIMPLSYNENN